MASTSERLTSGRTTSLQCARCALPAIVAIESMACSQVAVRLIQLQRALDEVSGMASIIKATVLLTAVLFVGISASMNALFLSSFGRTALEATLLVGVSVAADVVKAVLPVVLTRTIMQRAWGQAALCSVMLSVVIVMSIASGLGFAARLRSESVALQEGASAALKAREADLADLEQRLAMIPEVRSALAITTDIDAAKLDRSWLTSKSCTQTSGPVMRQFCERVLRLRGELAAAVARDRYHAERKSLRDKIAEMRQSGGSADADPQASALADLFGTAPKTARVLLTTGVAVVLELGSIILILLVAGAPLRSWYEPGQAPTIPREAVVVPASADRTHWNRQRQGSHFQLGKRGTPHVS